MIIKILVIPAFLALLYIVLPAGATLPAWLHTGAVAVGGYIKGLNYIFDTHHLFVALATVVVLEIIIGIWKGTRWLIHLFTGS